MKTKYSHAANAIANKMIKTISSFPKCIEEA